MADYKKIVPFIKKWEGGFVNDPDDAGGATNMGITIATFRSVYGTDKTIDDLKAMTEAQWLHIFKSKYWDRLKADNIECQGVANIMLDWVWGSGAKTAIKKLQQILDIPADGIVGPQTLKAVNEHKGRCCSRALFNDIYAAREKFFNDICVTRPQNKKFLKGWLRRLEAIPYED